MQKFGSDPYRGVSAASTNRALVRGAPGRITAMSLANSDTSAYYLRLYDAAAAADVTVGSTTPAWGPMIIPAGGGSNLSFPGNGLQFNLGIVVAVTAAAADSDTTATSANKGFWSIAHSK